MILPFSTQINGKPTHFIEKIWSSLLKIDEELYEDYLHPDNFPKQMPWPPSQYKTFASKLHTFREDKNDRWKPGVIIDFFINARQKNMFRFAPRIPVVSTQKVEIRWYNTFGTDVVRVFIDDKSYACVLFDIETMITGKILELAQNDGFDSIEDFFAYFNKDFTGKVIHWTDKRY